MNRKKESRRYERRRQREARSLRAAFSEYCRRIARRAEQAPKRLRLHGALFVATNAFLVLINLLTGFTLPWFLFPLGGWAILLVDHYVLTRQRLLQAEEVPLFDELSPHQTMILRKLHRIRSLFAVSLSSAVVASLFLVMTNLIVSPRFPWSAITAGALGLTAFVHYLGFRGRRTQLLDRISEDIPREARDRLSGKGGVKVARGLRPNAAASREIAQALDLRRRIESHLLGLGETDASLTAEIVPLLERYVDQIKRLLIERDDVRSLSHGMRKEELDAERVRLDTKLKAAEGATLKSEYARAIAQLDGQLESLRKLRERVEIADLRLTSAVGSLKQLELDVVRMKSLSEFEKSPVSQLLEDKLRDLSEYIDDLSAGRRELEQL